jgi:hypothetical protein
LTKSENERIAKRKRLREIHKDFLETNGRDFVDWSIIEFEDFAKWAKPRCGEGYFFVTRLLNPSASIATTQNSVFLPAAMVTLLENHAPKKIDGLYKIRFTHKIRKYEFVSESILEVQKKCVMKKGQLGLLMLTENQDQIDPIVKKHLNKIFNGMNLFGKMPTLEIIKPESEAMHE